MPGNDGIQFDTSTVRGFAEWLYSQVHDDGGYKSRIDDIIEKLGGTPGSSSNRDGFDSSSNGAQTMGTSGVHYYGKDYGVAQVKNVEAAVKYLNGLRSSLNDMATAAGVAAEDLPAQDGENSKSISDHIDLPEYEK
jgi:hypothetical protein